MPSAIDLFSGAGGLSLGLKNAGWSVQAAVEFDETAASTHALNFPEVEHLTCDVREIDFTKYSGIGGRRSSMPAILCQRQTTWSV
jgi:DNA (cytosine-5)-methyltransferase 1